MVATDQSLSELVEALPPELQESVRAFVEFLLARRLPTANFSDDTEAHDPFPIDPRRSLMLREVETYHQLHPELVGRYKGRYVAIFQGQMVDHDQDAVALSGRIREQFPDQVVLQRRVEDSPEVVLQFRECSNTGPEPLVDETVARRKATRWLVEYVGNMLTADEGRLIEAAGRPIWRFGAYVTGRGHAPLGPIGHVDIDAHTGELIPDQAARA